MLLGQIMFFINFPTRKYPLKENNVVNDKQKKNDTIVTFSNPICIPHPFQFFTIRNFPEKCTPFYTLYNI